VVDGNSIDVEKVELLQFSYSEAFYLREDPSVGQV
jgi:hypothetical protein